MSACEQTTMNKSLRTRVPRTQLGAGSLAVMLLLLFGASIIVFYLNRGLIFEQKTSANQVRATTAFEAAEAGVEWATGMLNSPFDIDTSCALLATTNTSFRAKYLGSSGAAAPVQRVYPGCKINGTTVTCSCPDVPGAANAEAVAGTAQTGTGVLPSFTVAFRPVVSAAAAVSVEVISTGCTAQGGVCKPDTASPAALSVGGVTGSVPTTGNSDAWAQVSTILTLRSLLRAAPSAALTCGTSCAVGGSYNIYNRDVASNGYLVNAGTTITSGNGTSYGTIPGQPIENALIASDTSLAAIAGSDPTCNNNAMFSTYFGTTIQAYADSPQVLTIQNASCGGSANCMQADCTNNVSCRTAMDTAYGNGWRNYYLPNGLSINNGGGGPWVLGASGPGNGVNIVSPGDIDINGNISIYGMIFSNSANVNDLGTGTANIYGAMVTCRGYNNNGNGTLTYDANALGGTGLRPGVMVRVPGSWRDFRP
jgi:hypothetical protein